MSHDIWVASEPQDHIMYRKRYMWHCTICHAEGDAATENDAYWQAQKHPCQKTGE